MEMEQMMAHLLAKMKAEIRINQAKTAINLKEINEEMMARLEATIEANNKKYEVLRCTLISRMDTQEARA
jgi:nucleoid-associated protein YejK